jgi:hypothetical protein
MSWLSTALNIMFKTNSLINETAVLPELGRLKDLEHKSGKGDFWSSKPC